MDWHARSLHGLSLTPYRLNLDYWHWTWGTTRVWVGSGWVEPTCTPLGEICGSSYPTCIPLLSTGAGAVRGPAAAPSDDGSDAGSDDGPEYIADQLLDFESEASAIAAEFLAQF